MKVACILAELAFSVVNLVASARCSPAKRLCRRKIDYFASNKVSKKDALLHTSRICDDCFNRIKCVHYGPEDPVSPAGPSTSTDGLPSLEMTKYLKLRSSIRNYLKIFNDNYQAYQLARDNKLTEAIAVLFKTAPEDMISVMYSIPFNYAQDDLYRIDGLYKFAKESLPRNCRCSSMQIVALFISYYNNTFFRAEHGTPRRLHEYYCQLHNNFTDRPHSNAMFQDSIGLLLAIVKRASNTKIPKCVQEYYSLILSSILTSKNVQSEIIYRAIFPFDINSITMLVDLKALYYLIAFHTKDSYQDDDHRAKIDVVVESALSNNDLVIKENIYDLFRLHKVCKQLPLSVFARFTRLVSDKIKNMESSVDRTIFSNIHNVLVADFITDCAPKSLTSKDLLRFSELKTAFPDLHTQIDNKETTCVDMTTIGANGILTILLDLCKAQDINTLENFLFKLSLGSSQIAALLNQMDASNLEACTAVCILFELVKCKVINARNNMDILECLEGNKNAKILYALALASFIYKYHVEDQELESTYEQDCGCVVRELARDISLLYCQFYDKNMDLFEYTEHMRAYTKEHYLLHVYDLSINFKCKAISKSDVWTSCILPRYGHNFFVALWNAVFSEEGIAPRNPCANELTNIKIYTFRRIKNHYDENPNLTSLVISYAKDLVDQGLSTTVIYRYYLDADPVYKNLMLVGSFTQYSLRKGREMRAECTKTSVETMIRELGTIGAQLSAKAENKLDIDGIKGIADALWPKIYKCKVKSVPFNKRLGDTIEHLIARLAVVWFKKKYTPNSAHPLELQVIIAFNEMLDEL